MSLTPSRSAITPSASRVPISTNRGTAITSPRSSKKIFVFGIGHPGIGVKCGANRAEADEWLLQYPQNASVMAYIGRNGWNTLTIGGAIPDAGILEAIDTSYELIVGKLPKSKRPT